MKIKEFDVFIIGSGVAGQTVAEQCVKNELTVAIADKRAYGGTCANRGCDPKKVILGSTEIIKQAKDLLGKGITKLPQSNWKDVMSFKQEFTAAVPAGTEEKLRDMGITLYHQSPKFIDSNTLSVEGKTIKANKIVIASGLVPRPLDIEGGSMALESDDFLNLEALPESIIFIGGGYIGMEFAHMAARFGVDVTIIESGDRPLSMFDPDMVAHLVQASKDLGIEFVFKAEVTAIEALRKNKRVHYSKNGKKNSKKAALVFNTTGRIPSIQDLNLEKGGVVYNQKGIGVNDFLQNPGNSDVYACGDIADNALPLTPFSSREGTIVAHNLFHGNEKKANFPVTPSVAFTLPNIASVGLSEEEAKKKYHTIRVVYKDAADFYNAKRINEHTYAYKIIIKDDVILGAHLVGPEAAEMINLFAMAIYNNMTTKALNELIFVYPSWGGDMQYMI
ncbi:NAD(P)/FAD-dependent oxidoreductase [Aquimarina sp. U1-2]|uniref:dihydrolipoyl dehydrogenase family protein n=1 Tax=Aquimarina sp. U1-2 TaxID=2823141 RepID=UPI001AEC8347|nr:NAD(P)/FAD-dependent oxidoreductase [Aquimarina sp. U1-2]MBP2833174.1 NAD(P)/FAD-dependent oxidoreductase [Aquimarina sp. U1-2]